ncbi:MAG: hypothetical protein JO011_06010 [Ktedonobacteraceae bacterium]|nr:hypothetical protein [Ktedonobacteraceae bacterium]
MAAYLITGESGTGKSSLATELQKRRYIAYDGDATPGLAYHADHATGKPISEKLARLANPLTFLNHRYPLPPFLIIHGTQNRTVPLEQ